MVVETLKNDNEPVFTIDNNVLKGKVESFKSRYTNVGALLLDKMRYHADQIGQVDAMTDIQDTFADMADRTIKCALWLKKQGIRRGDVVAVCTHNHLDSFVPGLATFCLGATFNPWDPNTNIQRARHFMGLSQPKVIFTCESAAGVLLETAKIEVYETTFVTFGDYPGTTSFSETLRGHSDGEIANFQCAEINDSQDTATILYSSGTTGLPKGVQLSYFTMLYNLEVSNGLSVSSLLPLWFSSLYWISGVFLTYHAIGNGSKRIVPPDFEEELACKIIEKYKVSWLFLGTSMASRLLKSGFIDKYDLSSVQVFFTGGASMKSDVQDELRAAFPNASVLQGYGLTEVAGLVSSQKPNSPSGSCGIVGKNTEIKVVDPETGVALGPNTNGELYVRCPTQTKGYYRNPEATKNTIDEEGWMHTGDLGYYNERGEIYIIDRLKELIKYRGHHVSPSEIENLLQTHPAVLEVAVVGVPHAMDDEQPLAFVVTKPGMKVTEEELKDLVASNLVDNCKLRGGVKFLDSLPHTASGKIARKNVRDMAKAVAT